MGFEGPRILRVCAAVSSFAFFSAGCAKQQITWTEADLPSLTNAVQSVTSNPIVRIDKVDYNRQVAVYTGTDGANHLFEWTGSGWKYLAAGKFR